MSTEVATVITLDVTGEPVPQGSLRAFARNGRVMTIAGNAGRLERWRGDVRTAARQAMGNRLPLTGPVALTVVFRFARPQSHLTSKGEVRSGAPGYPRADLDKLQRAILDALTGFVYGDDSQVVAIAAVKEYGDAAGASLHVAERGVESGRYDIGS